MFGAVIKCLGPSAETKIAKFVNLMGQRGPQSRAHRFDDPGLPRLLGSLGTGPSIAKIKLCMFVKDKLCKFVKYKLCNLYKYKLCKFVQSICSKFVTIQHVRAEVSGVVGTHRQI